MSPHSSEGRLLLELFGSGQYAVLEARLVLLVRDFPDSGFAWGLLGGTLQAQNKNGLPALERAVALLPQDSDAHSNLGAALLGCGRIEDAQLCLERALVLRPTNLIARFNYGCVQLQLGRLETAAESFRFLLRENPNRLDVLLVLSEVLSRLGQSEEAEAFCRHAIELNPGHGAAYFCLGNIQHRSGDLRAARASYIAAVGIDSGCAEAHNNLANVLQGLGQFSDAENRFREALKCAPPFLDAYLGLARLLIQQNRFIEAENVCRSGLRYWPGCPEINDRLGRILFELGRTEEAKGFFVDALKFDQNRIRTRFSLAIAALPILVNDVQEALVVPQKFSCALDELAEGLLATGGAVKCSEIFFGSQLPFFLAYRCGNHNSLLSRFGDAAAECLSPISVSVPIERDKCRLVIVSYHVHRHSVWDVVLCGLLQNIDRSRFEVILYHLGDVEDEETVRARSLVDGWHDRNTVVDARNWLDVLLADQPDVIYYPEVGMDPVTYFLAAHRIAPLQIAGWGHPVTTGLATMDIFLSGDLLEPVEAQSHYRERLVRLPGTGCCTMPLNIAPEPLGGIEKSLGDWSGPRFLIAQRAMKFDPADDELLVEIALAVGECVFVLPLDPIYPWASEKLLARIRQMFISRELDPDKFLLPIPWQSSGKFLSLLDLCDVFLDCPGFSGYTSAWQALQRGIPVVTMEGAWMRQRLAAGLLRHIGVTNTIAASSAEYVALAAGVAKSMSDPNLRRFERASICRSAQHADGDIRVVRAFEEVLLTELSSRGRSFAN